MKKHKIALLVEAPDVMGGIQSAAYRHASLLSEEIDVIPVAFSKSGSERDWAGTTEMRSLLDRKAFLVQAADLQSDHRWSSKSSIENIRQDLRFRSYADHLIEIIRSENISLVHAFGAFHQRGMIAAYAAAKCGIPYVLSLRGVDLETRMFDQMVAPLATSISAASAIVTVSEDSKDLLKSVFRPGCPIHVVRNSFDPTAFTGEAVDIPLLRNSNFPIIGCFGKFRRVMGLDFLLDAFADICKRREAVLLLGGSIQKREVEYYNKRIEECAAASNILRLGSIPHASMLSYLAHCTAVVYPSISDASPNKILEAMYARVPIISTRTGGIPELVLDERDAILVEPRSRSELVTAIERILDDPTLGRKLATNAHNRVVTEHTPEAELRGWREVYRQFVNLS